jgi:hypothetical protein
MNYAALWREIARHGLLGTDRGPLAPALRAELAALGVRGEDDTECLLEAAALLPLLRAGTPAAAPAPVLEPAPGEERAYAPPRAATALARILDRRPGALFAELTGLLRRHEYIVPPRLLPPLLAIAEQWPEQRPAIQPLLGSRGPWLAALHPRWRYHYPHPTPAPAWAADRDTGTEVYLLESWRHLDPAAARAALQAEWKELAKTPGRAEKLLAGLRVGLSAADAEWLHEILAAGRKSQRLVAAELLRELADEPYLQGIEDLLLGRLVDYDGTTVQVRYSKDLIAACRPLGIYPAGAAGGRYQTIRQLTAAFPMSRWAELWDLSATQLLNLLFGAGRDRDHFHHGVVDSLLTYPDPEANAALVRYWLATDERKYWDRAESWQLLATTEADLFPELVGEALDRGLGRLDSRRFLIQWLLHNRHPYTKRMALRLFAQIREYLEFNERVRYAFESQRLVKQLLRNLSLHADPAWLDELLAQWRSQPGHPAYDGVYQDFFEMLRFRGEVRRAVSE